MASLIKFTYRKYLKGERFWLNPRDLTKMLFINIDEDIISFPTSIAIIPKGIKGEGTRYIKSLTNYTVLTGKDAGKNFTNNEERAIPGLVMK